MFFHPLIMKIPEKTNICERGIPRFWWLHFCSTQEAHSPCAVMRAATRVHIAWFRGKRSCGQEAEHMLSARCNGFKCLQLGRGRVLVSKRRWLKDSSIYSVFNPLTILRHRALVRWWLTCQLILCHPPLPMTFDDFFEKRNTPLQAKYKNTTILCSRKNLIQLYICRG